MMRIINAVALMLVLAVNGLANWLPIGGQTTAEISAKYQVWFTPPNYVFSIWALIYVLLCSFVVYQALPGPAPYVARSRVGFLFALSCVVNSAWIVAWHYEWLLLSLVLMLVLLNILALIYVRLTQPGQSVPWHVRIPFSIYLAWISVATIANASVVLLAAGWSGLSIPPAAWSTIMMVIATVLALAVNRRRIDPAFSLVLVWALSGIACKFSDTPVVAVPGWILTGILLAAAVICPFRKRTG